ncbi:MAG: cache domain-containing protein [Desulfobaccales bacterium]
MFNENELIIYLIGVLALFLLAALTPILNRRTNRLLPWNWLGLFALCRGVHDLLNLPSLNQLLPGHLEAVKLILLCLSLIFLLEFGRAGSSIPGHTVPRPVVYFPLVALIFSIRMLGLPDLVGVVSFGVSVAAGAWAAWALLQASPKIPKGKETLITAGIFMVLYGLISCFPYSTESFNAVVGISISLVRSLLAIGLAASIFRFGQIAMDSIEELRAQKIYQYFTRGTTIGLLFIAAVGLAGSLGINYLANKAVGAELKKNQGTAQRLQEIVNNEMEKADRLDQLLAGSSRIIAMLSGPQAGPQAVPQERRGERLADRYAERPVERFEDQTARANEILDNFSQTEEGFGVCYIMNTAGLTIASSNRNQPDSFIGKNYGFRPYFKQAALGLQGRYFALGVTSKELGYYASAPVRNEQGEIIGVAVIKRMIRTTGELKNAFDPGSISFLVDPNGIVALSNQPQYILSSLWPVNEQTKKELVASQQFGNGPFAPILDQKPLAGKEYQLEGQRLMALARPISMSGWTILHFGSTEAIPFYKLLGAAAILVLGFALIGFYVSWDLTSYKTAGIAALDWSQAGATIDYGQIEEQLQQGERKYRDLAQSIGLVSEMGDLLQGCNSSRDAVPVITRYLQRLFPNLSGAIYLTTVRDTLEVMGVWGELAPEEQRFAPDDCWALRRGRQYLVEDSEASLPCPHLSKNLPPAYQCWPIAAQGKTLGLLHLRQGKPAGNPHPVSEQEKETGRQLISSVVDQFSMILVNLKLRENSQVQGILNSFGR